jgi:hypothetical protein
MSIKLYDFNLLLRVCHFVSVVRILQFASSVILPDHHVAYSVQQSLDIRNEVGPVKLSTRDNPFSVQNVCLVQN